MVHSYFEDAAKIHRPRCSEGITNLLPGCLHFPIRTSGGLLQWLKSKEEKHKKPPASNKLVSFCDEFEARSFLNHILYSKPFVLQTIDVPSDNNQFFSDPPMMLERIHSYVAAAKQRLDDCRSASTCRTQPEDLSGAPRS